MRSENMNEKMDDALRDIFQGTGKINPPDDFTRRVMERVEMQPAKKNILYQPVIPVRGWIAIAILILLLIVYTIIISGQEADSSALGTFLQDFDTGWFTNWIRQLVSGILKIQFSAKVILSLLAVGVLGCLEIVLRMNIRLKRS